MAPDEIAEYQNAIRHMHGHESTYVETSQVHEKLGDETVWQGDVHVFDLVNQPQAKRCYSWSFLNDRGKRQFVAVIGVGPVVDPVTAVRAYLVRESQKRG